MITEKEKFLDDYDPGYYSDNFIVSSHASQFSLINRMLVQTKIDYSTLFSLKKSNYRASIQLLQAFELYLLKDDPEVLTKTYSSLRNKTAKNLLKGLLALDRENQIYNSHHFINNLKNNYSLQNLRIDTLEHILYPYDTRAHKKAIAFRDYLNYKILYSPQDQDNLLHLLEHMKSGSNVIVVCNHPTYFTNAIILSELEYLNTHYALGISNFNTYAYIVLGGALMTTTQGKLAVAMGNIFKTHPQTPNGLIPQIMETQNKYNNKFVRQSHRVAGETTSDKRGKIFIVAPAGSKDSIERNGDTNSIYFPNDENASVQKSITYIQKLAQHNNSLIALIGMNESQLKNPKAVNPTNNDWNQGCYIPLKSQILTPIEFSALKESGKVMSTLASLVIDQESNIIGKSLTDEELTHMKKTREDKKNYCL